MNAACPNELLEDPPACQPGSAPEPLAVNAPSQRTALVSGYVVETEAAPPDEMLRVFAPDGRLCLKMTLTPEGPLLELSGVALAVTAQRDIQIRCERLDIQTQHGLLLKAGGDLQLMSQGDTHMVSAGDLQSEAIAHHYRATLGDIEMTANDDVLLNGERIRLNSPRTPTELAAAAPTDVPSCRAK